MHWAYKIIVSKLWRICPIFKSLTLDVATLGPVLCFSPSPSASAHCYAAQKRSRVTREWVVGVRKESEEHKWGKCAGWPCKKSIFHPILIQLTKLISQPKLPMLWLTSRRWYKVNCRNNLTCIVYEFTIAKIFINLHRLLVIETRFKWVTL